MILIKTKYIHEILCQNGDAVCYNTLLNLPVVLNCSSHRFFKENEVIDTQSAIYLENKELVDSLQAAYLMIEKGISEAEICDDLNRKYLANVVEGKTIQYVDLRISEICNFGCRHCISSRAQSGRIMETKMAINILDYVIPFMQKRQDNFSRIDLHYGNAEPLINYPVIKNVQQHLRKNYPWLNKVASINTNLSLLTETMADFFIHEDIAIYASLDGQREANDSIRVFKNGAGTFDVIWKKIKMLECRGKKLEGVSVTLTEDNFKYFDASFVDWCAENGFRSLAVDFDLVNSLGIPIDERVDFLTSMWQKCGKCGIEFFGTWITPFLNISNRSIIDKHYAFCKGVHGNSISVAPDGKMYLCGSSAVELGYYKDIGDSFAEGGAAYQLVSNRLIGVNKICKGCIIEGACAGQCHVTREYSEHNMEVLCDYYRKITERLLKIQGITDAIS